MKLKLVDQTKVTRSALQHAASIAAMFLTIEAQVADLPSEDSGGMSDMGGMDCIPGKM